VKLRLVVVGAGPVGIAAALGAVRRGFEVTVLERSTVGASLSRWGATRAFSPLAMNVPPGASELVELPSPDALLTGPEFVATVLQPLARSAPLAETIRERHTVLAIRRAGMSRGELVGHPIRAERAFEVLVATPDGERVLEADAVLDASGLAVPIALGVPGERSARVLHSLGELADLANRTILLVGHGHSASNAVGVLAAIAAEHPATRVVWAVRSSHLRPCVEVASDPLPERRRIVSAANDLAARPPSWLRVERRARVERIHERRVTLSGDRTHEVDHVIAMIGARPDHAISSELALDLAASTEGAGGIARKLANVTDCLSVPTLAPSDLASGEPGFHLVGAKSYGRARTFLLQTGYAHVETILDGLVP
jgi:thioredoxin reductase